MPLMSRSANALLAASKPCSTTASSSAVLSGTVAIRQCSITWSPSNTPSTVWVFPMSIVSSMGPSVERHGHVVDEPRAAHGGGQHEHRGTGPAGTGPNVAGSTSSR